MDMSSPASMPALTRERSGENMAGVEEPVADSEKPVWLFPSDFYGYLRPSRCGLRVWLREQGEAEDPPSAFAESLMRLGIEHERRHLERFPNHVDIAELPREEQLAATIAEVEAGERVIYQGRLHATATLAGREIEIVGLPDFMLPARRGYAIRDSKLNRRVGPSQENVRLQPIPVERGGAGRARRRLEVLS